MAATRIDRVLGFEHGLPPAYGIVAACVGLAFLLVGWRLHRFTLMVTGFLVGAFVGVLVAKWIQVERAWGVFVGGLSLAILSEPLSKVMIFLLAGLALGLGVGEAVHRWVSHGAFFWGFIPAFVGGGILSLWQMRLLVIISTALLGALAFIWGTVVALSAWVYAPLSTFHVRHPILAYIVLGLLILVGLVVQFKFSKKHKPEEI